MTGYVRADTSNGIANGQQADADLINEEFDAVVVAFSSGAGHSHDGSTSEGAPIQVIGPVQDFVAGGAAFYPKTNNLYDLGNSGRGWRDMYLTRNLSVGGNLSLTGTFSQTGGSTFTNASVSGDLDVQNLTAVDANFGTWAINNVTVTSAAAELNILDGATLSTTELNFVGGVTSNIQTQLNSKQPNITGAATTITLDNLTANRVLVSSPSGKVITSIVPTTNLEVLSGLTTSTNELNTLDGVTASTSEINILDGVTASTLEINILDGVTATTEELNLLSGATLNVASVTATDTELNILDGATLSTAELNILDGVTASTSELNLLDGAVITTAELNSLDNVGGNLSSSGWTRLPGGLILQWGRILDVPDNASGAISFPLPFPTACVSIVGSQNHPSASSTSTDNQLQFFNITGSSFGYYANDVGGNRGTMTFGWQAIGF